VASLFSLSSIVGPPLMTQLFGRFSAPDAAVRLPGAAFYASTVLAWSCFGLYYAATRERDEATVAASASGPPA